MIDESSDQLHKSLVILARVYIPQEQCVQTLFVDLAPCVSSTAQAIFDTIAQVLRSVIGFHMIYPHILRAWGIIHDLVLLSSERNIPWTNVCAFNSDNCNVMKGVRNGVIAKLRDVSPEIIDLGCVCHLANLAVGSALKTSPINLDELLCDINTHFCNRYV